MAINLEKLQRLVELVKNEYEDSEKVYRDGGKPYAMWAALMALSQNIGTSEEPTHKRSQRLDSTNSPSTPRTRGVEESRDDDTNANGHTPATEFNYSGNGVIRRTNV